MKTSHITWEHYEIENCFLISHLWVAPEERRQGKARKMLKEAISEMKKDGSFDVIRLSADSESEDSQDPIDLFDLVDFYESEGFEIEEAGDIVVMRYEF